MRRTYLFLALVVACPVIGIAAWWSSSSRAQPARTPAAEAPRRGLPLSQVILFNTGVGYFQRHGEVEGNTRIDLTFPLTDVNDLLKSLTVEDGDRLTPVSYDGAEPVEHTLRSFALDLTSNPTLGQILNQARGEKVEVNLESTAAGQPATMSGTVVGMEAAFENGTAETHHLNLLTADGLRRLPLSRILRIRFLNAHLEDEFRRALGTLAAGHSNQRRNVSLVLKGDGKRNVKIGYVVESPIWKASYRLVLGAKDVKTKLQGWAIVENASDEDWKDVRMVLVSGRPITFRSDLSEPLFVPRPTVNADVYASLKPPHHEGALPQPGQPLNPAMGGALGALGGGLAGGLGGGVNIGGFAAGGQLGFPGGFQVGGFGGGGFPGLTWPGATILAPGALLNRYQIDTSSLRPSNRLTWEQMAQRRDEMAQKRQEARERAAAWGGAIAESIEASAVDADRIGEEFSYTLDQKVNLSRQKSALLPVLKDAVEATRISVYNRKAHPRFPLRAVRVKNTTGQHLMQGPVAIFDGGRFAGDSKLPDLQPGQERLISYAMDLGVEVREHPDSTRSQLGVSVANKCVSYHIREVQTTTYELRNRSKQDRSVMVEHPISEGWDLTGKEKPAEKGREVYRFAWKAPAGKAVSFAVQQENTRWEPILLAKASDATLVSITRDLTVSKPVRDALGKVVADRRKLQEVAREVAELQEQLRALTVEQERLRANLGKVPVDSAIHKRYLEKLDQQETQIEKLQSKLAERSATATKLAKEYEQFIANLKAS